MSIPGPVKSYGWFLVFAAITAVVVKPLVVKAIEKVKGQ